MDGKASAAQNYLEHMLFDGSVKPTKLPLSLLEAITNNFSGDHEIGRGGFAVVYKVCVTLSLATQLCFCLAAAVLETRLHAANATANAGNDSKWYDCCEEVV